MQRGYSTYCIAIALALLAESVEAQAGPKCRGADVTSASLIQELKNKVSETDPALVYARDNIFRVPVVPVSQITLVTDERICGKLVEAYSRDAAGWSPVSLYVVRMGTKHFAVLDPNHKAGEFAIVKVFDSKYQPVGGWTGG